VDAQNGPDLASLVVRKSDGLPGEGYFTSLRSAGEYDGPSTGMRAEAVVRRRQEAVFAYYAASGTSVESMDRQVTADDGGPQACAGREPL